MFVGDGLNDAPAIAAAWVGVSMRHAAAPSLESASVNLLGSDLRALPELVRLARRALRTARANLAWGFGYNAVGLFLAVRGDLTPIFAASAMVVSSLLVALASSRLSHPATRISRASAAPAPSAPPLPEPALLARA
jgi:P-type E1-E2 ATPase